MSLRFKIATEPQELEQIHALNYRTFVEELPQHPPNRERRLVDRFHDQNTYAVSLENEQVVGMLAVRLQRPFSLDGKLANLDQYLPQGRSLCEIRLLAIDAAHRAGLVLPGLLSVLWEFARARGVDCAVISATTRQLKLYAHLGFTPFGPLVGTADAPFQPMIATLETFQERAAEARPLLPAMRGEVVNLLPGPVALHNDVVAAFHGVPRSHRGDEFLAEMRQVREGLLRLTGARDVQVLLGSGTLANDVIAGQLSLLGGRGVVVSNGEFGERLADHAARMRLPHDHVRLDWGVPLSEDVLRPALENAAWLWMTACETSTGVLNDVAASAALCAEQGVRLCLDAVSALGAVPLDLSSVYLASGASGKALGSYPGLSMVFHQQEPLAGQLPRYLDLALYAAEQSVPFTHSSSLLAALRVALERVDWAGRLAERAALGAWLRGQLRKREFTLVGEAAIPAPHVVTIALPAQLEAASLARALEQSGFLVAYASSYLAARNWIQLCAMGEVHRDALAVCVRELKRLAAASWRPA